MIVTGACDFINSCPISIYILKYESMTTDGNTKCLIQSIFPVRETNKMCIDDLYFPLHFLLVVIYRSVLNWCDPTLTSMMHFTNSLRIPRGNQKPSINRRGTDNTMTKNKDERATNDSQNTTQKLKLEQYESH